MMIFLMVTKGTGDDQTLTAANAVQDLLPALLPFPMRAIMLATTTHCVFHDWMESRYKSYYHNDYKCLIILYYIYY